MATATPKGSQTAGEAAAATVAPDAITAELLAKHAAGEKLTPAGYGKLGAFKASIKKLVGKGEPASQPMAPPSGNGPLLGASPSAEAPGDGLRAVTPDPGLVQRTTGAILKQCDGIARRYITRAARKAGADDKTVARFDAAAALPAASQELMTDVSPDVLAAFGMDPTNYPLVAFFGALGLWSTNLWLAVDELKAMEHRARVERLTAEGQGTPLPVKGKAEPTW